MNFHHYVLYDRDSAHCKDIAGLGRLDSLLRLPLTDVQGMPGPSSAALGESAVSSKD